MANKRVLKKAIKRACGIAAGACIESCGMSEDQTSQWGELVVNIALIQQSALRKVGAKFDREPSSFSDRRAYRRARLAFARSVAKEIDDYMRS